MNYKKIPIPCLFNNPLLNTYQRSQCGEYIPDSEIEERIVFFYKIDLVKPRVDENSIVIGSIICVCGDEYFSLKLKHEIDEIIVNSLKND